MIRFLLLSSLLSLYACSCLCQEVFSTFLSEGKEWVYEETRFEESADGSLSEILYESRYTLSGDTVIGGRSYMRMYCDNYEDSGRREYVGSFRESGDSVFWLAAYADREHLLYDFGMSMDGRRVVSHDPRGMEVSVLEYCDTVAAGDFLFKRECMGYLHSGVNLEIWVSGVGSVLSPLPLSTYHVTFGKRLLSCRVDGVTLFTSEALSLPPGDACLLDGLPLWSYETSVTGKDNVGPHIPVSDASYFLFGDTVMDGRCYKRVFVSENRDYSSYTASLLPSSLRLMSGRYVLGLREEGGRVYANSEEYRSYIWNPVSGYAYAPYPETEDGEIVLYDFNMCAGDRYLSSPGHEDVWVSETGTLTTSDGVARRTIRLSNGLLLVEGVGAVGRNSSFLNYLGSYCSADDSYEEYDGVSYSHVTDFIFFKNGRKITGWEDLNTVREHDFFAGKENSHIYDLQGRLLSSPPRHGVYIQGGRKLVR